MSVVSHVAYVLAGFRIVDDGATRHVDIHILAVGAVALVASAVATVAGEDVALVLQVEQSPVVVVATQIDVSATATVTTVRSAIGVILYVAQMHGTAAALSGTAQYLYVVYKVAFGHKEMKTFALPPLVEMKTDRTQDIINEWLSILYVAEHCIIIHRALRYMSKSTALHVAAHCVICRRSLYRMSYLPFINEGNLELTDCR